MMANVRIKQINNYTLMNEHFFVSFVSLSKGNSLYYSSMCDKSMKSSNLIKVKM